MATAIKISFITPSSSRGARVKAFASGAAMATVGYDHALDLQGNAEAALAAFLLTNSEWGSASDWALGTMGDSDFVAVLIPRRYIKARDAVLLARQAISQGENNGNAHAKAWGQAITDLTDGIQPDGFSGHYTKLVLKGGL